MRFLTRILGLSLAGLISTAAYAQSDYPSEPLRIIVPTDAGGSVDALARIFQRGIEKQKVYPSVVVVNLPGAGGTIGTRALREAKPDGYTIALWTSGVITSKAMGVVDYDHTAFTVLGGTGQTEIGMGVLDSSPIKTPQDLIEMSKANPGSITVATNIGLPVFFIPMMFQEEAGIEMKFVQIGGGAKRLASILGGHTDIAQFSVSEFQQYKESGLRPLFLYSQERSAELPDVPTAVESGVNLSITEPRIWIAPAGLGDAEAAKLREVLSTVAADPNIVAELEGQGIDPTWYGPEPTKEQLDDAAARTEPLAAAARGMSGQ
uniref:Bug family tripartite tricarboxylate transporter substrate binding protein n=1 Tax=Pararhizobium sp. IMCC3301 TaxID=3067904 RepID=UPI00274144F5|nr:tripartite tricarboxylate transporter substrate binding protein [Pararhizobium sp. IMCC3301]